MEIDAKGPDGNAFAIMGYVRRIFREMGRKDFNEVQAVMMSGNYEQLCEIAERETDGILTIVNRD
ncbi:MAG: hypothetical protein ACWGQW_04155 [bacterium]